MKIKHLLIALTISFLFYAPAQAQDETRHEIGISYGTVPNSIWIDVFNDVILSMSGVKYESHSYVGPIGLEYFYHTSPLVGIGAVATFVHDKKDGQHNGQDYSKLDDSFVTFMPAVKLNWLRRNNWGLYSKLALGATYNHSSEKVNQSSDKSNYLDDKVLFNFQASAIGVEFGSERTRGFVEAGVGEQGILLGGLRFKF